jgi:MFS transporter, FHS family, L-fucose permease
VCPIFMGWIADISKMAYGFVVPLLCFSFIIFFGLRGYKVKSALN